MPTSVNGWSARLLGMLGSMGLGWGAIAPVSQAQVTITPTSNPSPMVMEMPYTQFEAIEPALLSVEIPAGTGPLSASVSAPFLTAGFPDPSGTVRTGFLQRGIEEVTHMQSLSINQTGTLELGVRMLVQRPTSYPAGTYRYTVQLTVAPQ